MGRPRATTDTPGQHKTYVGSSARLRYLIRLHPIAPREEPTEEQRHR